MTIQILEWAPFVTRSDVSEHVLREAAIRLEREFLVLQPGFVRRELVQQHPGSYVDLVWWETRELAERAMALAHERASCKQYFSLMADAGTPCSTYDVLLPAID